MYMSCMSLEQVDDRVLALFLIPQLMVRDKLNSQQMTEPQVRKKCCALLSSREPRHLQILEQAGLLQTHP